jgi:hypothetical protein
MISKAIAAAVLLFTASALWAQSPSYTSYFAPVTSCSGRVTGPPPSGVLINCSFGTTANGVILKIFINGAVWFQQNGDGGWTMLPAGTAQAVAANDGDNDGVYDVTVQPFSFVDAKTGKSVSVHGDLPGIPAEYDMGVLRGGYLKAELGSGQLDIDISN